MAPHRIVAQSLGTAAASSTTLGVGAAIIGIVTGFQAWLFAGLIVAMLLDGITGANRARSNPNERYDPHADFRGWRSKGARLALVVLALVIDAMLVAVASEVSPSAAAGFAHGWVTAGAIGWLFRIEARSVIDNVKRTEGAGVIPPGMEAAIDEIGGMGKRRSAPRRSNRPTSVPALRIAPSDLSQGEKP